ncbi:MAG TPA: Flp pilus assembly protein CpaB [Nitrospiraceae bacterium]|nr:Flp pilus assembly protein CpaB [Nitrospiraceae bacterium]
MNKYKSFLMLGLGIIVALVTSVMTYNWLQKNAEARVEKPRETLNIAVASIDLPWGKVITKDMVSYKPFLKESLPKGSFDEKSTVEGRVVITPVKADEPIFESSLAPQSIETGGVAAVISPNKRAMAVKVDKVIGVSGFIYPGHRVDVLVTLSKDGKQDPVTKTVLENILVLAVGTKVEAERKGQKPTEVDVITLEVTATEAEKLAHAATEGKVQLAMRNFTDTQDVLTKGSTRSSLLSSYSSSSSPAKYRTVSKRKTDSNYSVEVIKGSEVSKVRIKRGDQ